MAGRIVKDKPADTIASASFDKKMIGQEEAIAKLTGIIEIREKYFGAIVIGFDQLTPRQTAEYFFSRSKTDDKIAQIDLEEIILKIASIDREFEAITAKASQRDVTFLGDLIRAISYSKETNIDMSAQIKGAIDAFEESLKGKIRAGCPDEFNEVADTLLKYSCALLQHQTTFGQIRDPRSFLEDVKEAGTAMLLQIAQDGEGEQKADFFVKMINICSNRLKLIDAIIEENTRLCIGMSVDTVDAEYFRSSFRDFERSQYVIDLVKRLIDQEFDPIREIKGEIDSWPNEIMTAERALAGKPDELREFFRQKLDQLAKLEQRADEALQTFEANIIRKVGREGLRYCDGYKPETSHLSNMIEQNRMVCEYYERKGI